MHCSASKADWLRTALGFEGTVADQRSTVNADSYVLSMCANRTEAGIFSRILASPRIDTNVEPELALTSEGIVGGSHDSSCVMSWGLVYLHWAEVLAATLRSPLLADSGTREVILLQDLRKYVSMAWQCLFKSQLPAEANETASRYGEPFEHRLRRIGSEMSTVQTISATSLNNHTEGPERAVAKTGKHVLALFCGGLRGLSVEPLVQASKRYDWQLRVLAPLPPSNQTYQNFPRPHLSGKAWLLDDCMRAYEMTALAELGEFKIALLWSPLAEAWEPDTARLQHTFWNINAIATRMSSPGNIWPVVGFPSVSSSGLVWPVRRIRWQYWKLQYFVGPSGHAGVDDGCFMADSTSATRLVRAEILLGAALAGGSTWLSAIDLAALKKRAPGQLATVLTCPTVVLYEQDWLPHVRLNAIFAITHHIEAARWTCAPGAPQEFCLVLSPDVAQRLVKYQGVVLPWCFRRHLFQIIDTISGWWRKRNQSNIVGATGGTLLALMRGNRPMPWDHDADLFLLSRQEFLFREHLTVIKRELETFGCSLVVGGDAVQDGFVCAKIDCTSPNGIVVSVDVFFQGGDHELNLRAWVNQDWVHEASLLASKLHVELFTFLGMAGEARFGKKLMRAYDGMRSLQCFAFGHNACLPNCTDTAYCEFEDNFVLLDSWLD